MDLNSLKLLGITVRTNNKNEMDPKTSKIATTAGMYWNQNIANRFTHRKKPGVTYAVYTEFESNEHGEYTYFIGELVDDYDDQSNLDFTKLTIPTSRYQKFTTASGQMPNIVISAWQEIWQMESADFGGTRKYIADFEVYDQRASDLNNAVVDIFIGIE